MEKWAPALQGIKGRLGYESGNDLANGQGKKQPKKKNKCVKRYKQNTNKTYISYKPKLHTSAAEPLTTSMPLISEDSESVVFRCMKAMHSHVSPAQHKPQKSHLLHASGL